MALLLVSSFLFIPTLFLQQSFANTTIFTVKNKIYINATGISPSANEEPQFVTLELEVSQSANRDGTGSLQIQGEGDTTFTPSEEQEWNLFKDMKRVITSDPTDYFEPVANMISYFGFPFINGSLNCSPIAGSYLESQMPAVSIGSMVNDVMLIFESPATYAASYCSANGYTYLNVINATYEQVIDFNAINTYRSRFLESAMYTLTDNSTLALESSNSNSTMSTQGFWDTVGTILYIVGAVVISPVLLTLGLALNTIPTGSSPAPPSPPPELDPPPANEIENMTIVAIQTFGHSADEALTAYLNGTIDFATYQAIVQQLGEFIFGGLNNSVIVLEDLWRDYYNTSESMYNTYSDMYDNYLEAFSASWTDWLRLLLIIIVVIIVLVIVYKFISVKVKGPSVVSPTLIVPKS